MIIFNYWPIISNFSGGIIIINTLSINISEFQQKQIQLTKELAKLDSELAKFPNENLIFTHNNGYAKCFKKNKNGTFYLPSYAHSEISLLARKYYLTIERERANALLLSINAFLKHYKKYERFDKKIDSLSSDPAFIKLYQAVPYQIKQKKYQEWMNGTYPTNPAFPEAKKHKTLSGFSVRSKSEVFIANALLAHNVPFRYECQLSTPHGIFYPDFTILHPQKEDIIYWEHFGMMDNSEYATNVFQKIAYFNSIGIIPGVNLIMTFETKDHPLTTTVIENTIRSFF